jgi:CheY-like chemotaxis protein
MSKRHIALIDDDAICRMVVKKQIASSEYDTETSEYINGFEAFQQLKLDANDPTKLPDVIFLDIFMPLMNGWEFLDRMEEIIGGLQKVPQIFVLSSTISVEDIERAENNSLVSGFIPKPVKLRQVQRIVNKAQYYSLSA